MEKLVTISVDPADIHRLKRDLARFDPALERALRRGWRDAGRIGRDEIRHTLGSAGPGRAALAAATGVRLRFTHDRVALRLYTSGSKLPPEHKGFQNVWNQSTSRHPLFGDKAHWFVQQGDPYFRTSIFRVMPRIAEKFYAALDAAVQATGAHGQ